LRDQNKIAKIVNLKFCVRGDVCTAKIDGLRAHIKATA